MVTSTARALDAGEFRNVLGRYPTGVAVVTTIAESGEPAGMVVGTFNSVSLDPPLIAFLPDKRSTTFPRIRESGRFCVNVLAADQQQRCRSFSASGGDKFADVPWGPAPSTGSPLLDGVVAWIDCEVETIHEAGDHYIVIGRVLDLGSGVDRSPLLFFQSGYGSFTATSLSMPARPELLKEIHYVDLAQPELNELAADGETECLILAHKDDQLLMLASARGGASGDMPSRVGQRQPHVPPMGALFVAWESEKEVAEWISRAAPGTGTAEEYHAIIERVRARGWTLGLASVAQAEFEAAVSTLSVDHPTEEQEDRLRKAAKNIQLADTEPADLRPNERYHVRSIGAPVFGPTGRVELVITSFGFRWMTTEEIFAERDKVLAAAESVTRKIDGQRRN